MLSRCVQVDMKELNIDLNKSEEFVMHHSSWRSYLQAALKVEENNIMTSFDHRRRLQKKKLPTNKLQTLNSNDTMTNGFDP